MFFLQEPSVNGCQAFKDPWSKSDDKMPRLSLGIPQTHGSGYGIVRQAKLPAGNHSFPSTTARR